MIDCAGNLQTPPSFPEPEPRSDDAQLLRHPSATLTVKCAYSPDYRWTPEQVKAELAESGLSPEKQERVSRIIFPGEYLAMKRPGVFPDEVLLSSDPVHWLTTHIIDTAHRPQSALSFLFAIVATGVVLARRCSDSFGTTTNLILGGAAPSGAGKDHPRQMIMEFFRQILAEDLVGSEDATSGTALARALVPTPVKLFLFDEAGKLNLEGSGKNPPPHVIERNSMLLRLFTSGGNPAFKPKAYADPKNEVTLNKPSVSVIATSTFDWFSRIDKSCIEDGFLSRAWLFRAPEKRPHLQTPSKRKLDWPEELIEWGKAWASFQPIPEGANLPWNMTAEEKVIGYTEDALTIRQNYILFCDIKQEVTPEDQGASIWARAPERALKLALIRSACRHGPHDSFSITADVMTWAVSFTNLMTLELLDIIQNHVSTNERSREVQRMLDYIREARHSGRTTSELARRFRGTDARTRKELLADLVECRDVASINQVTGGRPVLKVVASEFSIHTEP